MAIALPGDELERRIAKVVEKWHDCVVDDEYDDDEEEFHYSENIQGALLENLYKDLYGIEFDSDPTTNSDNFACNYAVSLGLFNEAQIKEITKEILSERLQNESI